MHKTSLPPIKVPENTDEAYLAAYAIQHNSSLLPTLLPDSTQPLKTTLACMYALSLIDHTTAKTALEAYRHNPDERIQKEYARLNTHKTKSLATKIKREKPNILKILDMRTLTGIHALQYLPFYNRCLHIERFKGEDLSPLATLTDLEKLTIRFSEKITDLQPLAQLQQLRELHLEWCPGITNIGIVQDMKQLSLLELSTAQSIDLQGLHKHPRLQHLKLTGAWQSSDLQPLLSLPNLRKLSVFSTHKEEYTEELDLLFQTLTEQGIEVVYE